MASPTPSPLTRTPPAHRASCSPTSPPLRPGRSRSDGTGEHPYATPPPITCRVGEAITLPANLTAIQPDALSRFDDPQACLYAGVATAAGAHSVFVPIHRGSCRYWLPIALNILPAPTYSVDVRVNETGESFEPVDLTPLLRNNVADILGREYTSPRSPFCSLALPDHLLGAAPGFDPRVTIDDSGLRSAGGTLHCASGRAIPASQRSPSSHPPIRQARTAASSPSGSPTNSASNSRYPARRARSTSS